MRWRESSRFAQERLPDRRAAPDPREGHATLPPRRQNETEIEPETVLLATRLHAPPPAAPSPVASDSQMSW